MSNTNRMNFTKRKRPSKELAITTVDKFNNYMSVGEYKPEKPFIYRKNVTKVLMLLKVSDYRCKFIFLNKLKERLPTKNSQFLV